MRVERDRVGELDPAQRPAPALGQRREAAVGGVDVQPRAVPRQISASSGSGSIAPVLVEPALTDTNSGRAPRGGVGGQRAGQQVGAHAVLLVDRQHLHLVGAEAERARRPRERRVRLVGDVDDEVVAHRARAASRARTRARSCWRPSRR